MATTCAMASALPEKPSSKLAPTSHFLNRLSHCDLSTLSPLFYSGSRTSRKTKKIGRASRAAVLKAAEQPPRAAAEPSLQHFKLAATLTVQNNVTEVLKDFIVLRPHNGRTAQGGVVLQLISTETDPRNMKARMSEEATLEWSRDISVWKAEKRIYKLEFSVDSEFGVAGAILVTNNYQKEFFLESISLEGGLNFPCNSWVQPYKSLRDSRVFFSCRTLLPSQTPLALRELREKELRQLRGDGKGTRKSSDRIYDFDVYNDLGNLDKGREFARSVMGGETYPYPRRCRTGRPPTTADCSAEVVAGKGMPMYVPRDEAFGNVKEEAINQEKIKGIFNNVLPRLKAFSKSSNVIKCLNEINGLYQERVVHSPKSLVRWLPGIINESISEILKFEPPRIFSSDSSCCLRDDEFARQTLAGMNPLSIERVKVFPPESKLDPSIYGPQTSALREEHIAGHLNGMSIQQALKENKLFMLDYHDYFLPFLDRINSLGDQKAYATRAIFFQTEVGSLKPVAIELSLSPSTPDFPSKRVFTPPTDATTHWLWQLAKAHVSSNDTGVHQLIHHWLRAHACMEPFIIAAHRQLSAMHPIHKLLDPHLRYTMEINAQAREYLLCAEGIIESFFSSGKYSMEMTSFAYRNWWRFDLEGLPADLIRRGMAVPDPTEAHGLRLLIEDYPYANDGLLIWSAIERLVKTYVNYYYQDASSVQLDMELQAWYGEAIKVGHADLRHASRWPQLSTPEDLSSVLTTIIWIVTGHHAAVNFGQYAYGAYVPSRPPLMRQLVPYECGPEYTDFLRDPQGFFLSSLPSLYQIGHYMSILHTLSTHSPDEEYIGDQRDLSSWSGDREILEAFYRFGMEMKRIEKEIEKRNANPNLRNRCGAGITSYELLMPTSGAGISCRGVPNSVSI